MRITTDARCAGDTGFTLVEMIVTILIAASLFALGSTVISGGFRAYFLGREITQDDWQARLALERMGRELHAIRSATPADLNIGVAGQISFTDLSGRSIVYRRTGTAIERSQNAGVSFQPLADHVSALSFTYLRTDGQTAAAAPPEVYYISAQLTVSSANVSATYRSTVRPAHF